MILELLGLFFGKSIVKQVDDCAKEIDNLSDEIKAIDVHIDNLSEEDVVMIEQLLDDED